MLLPPPQQLTHFKLLPHVTSALNAPLCALLTQSAESSVLALSLPGLLVTLQSLILVIVVRSEVLYCKNIKLFISQKTVNFSPEFKKGQISQFKQTPQLWSSDNPFIRHWICVFCVCVWLVYFSKACIQCYLCSEYIHWSFWTWLRSNAPTLSRANTGSNPKRPFSRSKGSRRNVVTLSVSGRGSRLQLLGPSTVLFLRWELQSGRIWGDHSEYP